MDAALNKVRMRVFGGNVVITQFMGAAGQQVAKRDSGDVVVVDQSGYVQQVPPLMIIGLLIAVLVAWETTKFTMKYGFKISCYRRSAGASNRSGLLRATFATRC